MYSKNKQSEFEQEIYTFFQDIKGNNGQTKRILAKSSMVSAKNTIKAPNASNINITDEDLVTNKFYEQFSKFLKAMIYNDGEALLKKLEQSNSFPLEAKLTFSIRVNNSDKKNATKLVSATLIKLFESNNFHHQMSVVANSESTTRFYYTPNFRAKIAHDTFRVFNKVKELFTQNTLVQVNCDIKINNQLLQKILNNGMIQLEQQKLQNSIIQNDVVKKTKIL